MERGDHVTTIERRPAISLEYLEISITAALTLDAQTVEFAFQLDGDQTSPAGADWHAATWIGDEGTTRTARLLVGPGGALVLEAGYYNVWYRVDATPEIPARVAGRLELT